MLTDIQIENINKLDAETCLQIMHECAERLGVVSVEEYEQVMHMPRRTIYAKMDKTQIPYFEISGHKFPIINK